MKSRTDDLNEGRAPSPRLWLGVILTYLSIPLILLGCGGDFSWWQAWVFSVLIVAAGIGGRIWAEKRHPGLLFERITLEKTLVQRDTTEKALDVKPWDKVLAPLMGLSLSFPLVIVAGLDHRFGWSPVFTIWLSILGLILIALGYTFAVWALAENRFFSSMVRIQTDRGACGL